MLLLISYLISHCLRLSCFFLPCHSFETACQVLLSKPWLHLYPILLGLWHQLVKLTFFPFETHSFLYFSDPTACGSRYTQLVNIRTPGPCSLFSSLSFIPRQSFLGPHFVILMLLALRYIYPAQASLLNSTLIWTTVY